MQHLHAHMLLCHVQAWTLPTRKPPSWGAYVAGCPSTCPTGGRLGPLPAPGLPGRPSAGTQTLLPPLLPLASSLYDPVLPNVPCAKSPGPTPVTVYKVLLLSAFSCACYSLSYLSRPYVHIQVLLRACIGSLLREGFCSFGVENWGRHSRRSSSKPSHSSHQPIGRDS